MESFMLRLFLLPISMTVVFLNFSGCAGMFENRSFITEMDRISDDLFVAGRDFETLPGDSGQAYRSRKEIDLRTPMNPKVRERLEYEKSIKSELALKERELTQSEYLLYKRYWENLPTDYEKLYYLNLEADARREYARSFNIPEQRKTQEQSLYSQGQFYRGPAATRKSDLTIGMTKEQVEKLWGYPDQIEIAGNPLMGNERWAFQNSFVYFEYGRVNGWVIQ
jgi:hypothetical protein